MARPKTKGNRIDFRPTLQNEKLVKLAMVYYGVNRSDALNKLLELARPVLSELLPNDENEEVSLIKQQISTLKEQILVVLGTINTLEDKINN